MKTKTHFAFRVNIWDDTGDAIVEHVAGADDFQVAEATYRAANRALPDSAHHAAAGHPGGARHRATASPLKARLGVDAAVVRLLLDKRARQERNMRRNGGHGGAQQWRNQR